MLIEGLSQTILRWLRIPPDTSLRKTGEVSTGSGSVDMLQNEYVDAIVGITVDDVCIGESPLSISYADGTPELVQTKLDEIKDECNRVVKGVAWDLCTLGFSVYDTLLSKQNKLILLPHQDPVTFFLTRGKKIVACNEDNEPLSNVLIFLNYNRRCLTKIEDDDRELAKLYAFSVVPEPMQLNNAQNAINSLISAESNLDKYRALSSRPVRFLNVDVGMAQGDQQKDVVDTISSAINCNSSSLTSTSTNDYDDNIPVLPNRHGLGEAKIEQDVPQYDLNKLVDLDHHLNKLGFTTRFPSTYMNFSKNLGESVVSTLRGDIRYNKLCDNIRSKIVDTLNDFINSSEKFHQYLPTFVLTKLPTPEDEEVMNALGNYVDITHKAKLFVIGEDESEGVDRKACIFRLQLMEDLFISSTTSHMLQKWYEDFRQYIDNLRDIAEVRAMEAALGISEEGKDGEGGHRRLVKQINLSTGKVTLWNTQIEAAMGNPGLKQSSISQACNGKYGGGHTYKGSEWYFTE